MNLQELKSKNPEELLKQADKLGIENPSSLRKQDLMFAILKTIADEGTPITGLGVIEIMQDGFGFLRSSESNYLPGPDDIYVSPSQIKKYCSRKSPPFPANKCSHKKVSFRGNDGNLYYLNKNKNGIHTWKKINN